MYNEVYPVEVLEEAYDEHFEPTENEILEQCKVFGIDPSKEPEFVYIAKEALKAPLPDNWKPICTQNEDVFYFDSNTGESTWIHPCDSYYESLLHKEREKKAATSGKHRGGNRLKSNRETTPSSHAPISGGVGLAGKKDIPPSLSLNKPPIFGPIGSMSQPSAASHSGHTLGPLDPLPSLKPLAGGNKKPLPSLKPGPSLGESQHGPSLNLSKAPPLKTLKNDEKHTKSISTTPISGSGVLPISKAGSNAGVKSMVAGSGDSTLVVTKPSQPPPAMITTRSPPPGLDILQLSNHYEEENETTEEESVDEETSFGKKYNLMGMEDLMDVTSSHDTGAMDNPSNDNKKEDEQGRTSNMDKKLVSSHPIPFSSYFMKSSNPLQDTSSPSHTPVGSPSLRPGAARGARTKVATSSLVKEEERQLDEANSGSIIDSTSSSDGNISMGQVQGDMVKKHQETLERIKQDHSNECEMLQKQFQQEIKQEKEDLANEKSRKLSLIKEQIEEEITKEKNKLEKEHREKMDVILKTIKEEEDEAEAQLQEKKEDTLRDLKRKLNKEQQNEEEQLRKAKDCAIADLKKEIEDTRTKMETELKDIMNRRVSDLKTKLEQETESEIDKLQNENNKEIEKLKKEIKDKLDQEKSDLLEKYQQELITLKESLSKEHARLLEECHNKTTSEFAKQKKDIEEQKLLQSSVEEEIRKSLELKKREMEEMHKEEMLSMKTTHEANLTKEKQKCAQEFEMVQAEWEQKITNLKIEKNKEFTKQQGEYEQTRIELENKKIELVKERQNHDRDVQELDNERKSLANKKEEIQEILKDLEKQIEEKRALLSGPPTDIERKSIPERERENIRGILVKAEKHFQRLSTQRDGLLKEIEKLEAHKETEKLEAHKETLLDNVKNGKHRLVQNKPLPQDTPTCSSVPDSPQTTPHSFSHRSQTPIGHTHSKIKPISDNLIFQNPAASSTSLLEEERGGDNVTITTDMTSYTEETIVTSDIEEKRVNSGIADRWTPPIQQVPSLHLSDLNKPNRTALPIMTSQERGVVAPPISFPIDIPRTNCEPNNMWTKVKNQIKEEGQALLKLEKDFSRGPVKRLHKIERMLDDMKGMREEQDNNDSDNTSTLDGNHSHYGNQSLRKHANPSPVTNKKRYLRGQDPVVLSKQSKKISKKLVIEDLESDIDSTTTCATSTEELKNYSPRTQEIIKQSRQRRHRPKQSHDQVYVTLDRISGQLGEVLHRLNERENEQDHSKENHLHVFNSSDQSQYKRIEFDKELHDRWQEYLDQAAKDDSLRYAGTQRHSNTDPPVGKTRIDIAGHSLIQRQKDWLKEFKLSLPPLRGRYKHH